MAVTDDQLIRDCRRDPGAYRELVERYQRRVYSFLNHLVGREAADDLFQEVFLRVLERSKEFDARGKASSWIIKIAQNVATDRLRKESLLELGPEDDAALQVPEPAPGPLAVLEREETRRLVNEAIKKLPRQQREVFLLREYGELSFQEIADETGVPLGTVLSRMNYALRKLRTALGETGG